MNKVLSRMTSMLLIFTVLTAVLSGCKNDETGGENDYSEAYNAYDRTGERYDYDLSEYVKLSQYKGITIPKVAFTVTDEKLEKEMLRKIAYYAPWEDGEDNIAENGDIVAITSTCYVDDQIYSVLTKTSSYSIVVGGGIHDIPELDTELLGVKAGDEKVIEFDFPDPYYQDVSLSGEHARIEVKILDVDDLQYPDDWTDIVKKYYGTTVEQLREDTRTSLVRQYGTYTQDYEISLAWRYVYDNSEATDYPEAEYNELYDYYISSYKAQAEKESLSLEDYIFSAGDTIEGFRDHIDEMVKQEIYEEMLLYYIARCENITVSDNEYKEAALEYAASYEVTDESAAEKMVVDQYGSEEAFRETVRFSKVYEFLGESANVDETKLTVK